MEIKSLPTGTVTFLFTDIEGSTKLWQTVPEAMKVSHARHNEILKNAIALHQGHIFNEVGDAFCVAFHSIADALHAAVRSQTDLQNENWGDAVIKVRMGIHYGPAELKENGDYFGYLTLSKVQRISSAGHGAQVLLSEAVKESIQGALPDGVTVRDMGLKRLKDMVRPEPLYQLIIPGLPTEFPPLSTLEDFRTNLPAILTTFIGREKEISELKKELKEHRLITLTGSGGTGKTRLSQQVASELLEDFHDGVWFVELAALSDPDLIPVTILTSLNIKEQPGQPAQKTIEEFFQNKKSLVILDNCEHLITSAAQIASALLSTAPKLHILATSREALGVIGELAWHVPSLTLPNPKKLPEIKELIQFESVQLFLERAALINPSFSLSSENASSIAQICSRLDGIPLALELAAARTKILPVEQISARLDDRFRLLTGGARTALPRQQTLRAMIDWSYELLSENERLLLRRLAVFAGGWTLELAEKICADEKIGVHEILDTLAKLVDKSLAATLEGAAGMRYRILETIRQYAREKLMESGEGERMRDQHLKFIVEVAEKAEPEIRGANQLFWLDQLEDEIDNLRAALEWSQERNAELCIRLTGALWRFWDMRGYNTDALEWFPASIALSKDNPTIHSARLLSRASTFYRNSTNSKLALQVAQDAITLAQALGDKASLAQALTTQGELTLGDSEFTSRCFDEAFAICNELGDHWQASTIWYLKGQLIDRQGDRETAKSYTEKGLHEARLSKDSRRISLGLSYMAFLALDGREYTEAKSYMIESVEVSRQVGDTNVNERVLHTAFVDLFLEDYVEAEELLNEALDGFQQTSESFYVALTFANLALVAWIKDDFAKFVELLRQASNTKQNDEVVVTAYIDFLWGMTALHNRDIAGAEEKFKSALRLSRKLSDRVIMLACLSGFGMLALEQGQLEQAAKIFGAYQKFEQYHQPHIPFIQRKIEEQIVTTRERAGNESFERAFNQGQEMTVEQAVAYALKESNE